MLICAYEIPECLSASLSHSGTMSSAMQPTRLPPEQRGEMAVDLRRTLMTYCEKMNAKNVYQVIRIIRKLHPGIYDNDEIELDMAALDNTTLWTLWDYFEDNAAAREAAKAKRKRG